MLLLIVAGIALYHAARTVPVALGSRAAWAVVLCSAPLLCIFMIHFGRLQFGGYDMSVVIDTGWRLHKGQRLYEDFLCTMPPAFCLGAKYSFLLFGVAWDSQLYVAASFAVITYLWSYALLSRLIPSRLGAVAAALMVQCLVHLSVCFWWYNAITSITATVFVLTCALWTRAPESRFAQVSYIVSLALLTTMKPNVAGVLIVGAGIVLFAAKQVSRGRLLLLTSAAFAMSVAAALAQGVSPIALVSSYAMARSRIRPHFELSLYGMPRGDQIIWVAALFGLGLPLAVYLLRNLRRVKDMTAQDLSFHVLIYLGACVAFWAMLTNAELKLVDMPMLAVAAALLNSGETRERDLGRRNSRWLTHLSRAALCWVALQGLYLGIVRYRVEGIGYGSFYEPELTAVAPGVPFFSSMHTGQRFPRVVAEIKTALAHPGTGTVFFGPRMEWGYAAFNLPSPEHVPVWWHKGSSYAVADEAEVFKGWRQHRFDELIFLKDDLTDPGFYDFLPLVKSDYVRDDSFPNISLFRRIVR